MNNRGSGIVTVLITVAFVAMLGVVLLFAAYMNTRMKSADRATRRNFYTTESALDEVRAALQNVVSDTISKSYTSTLILYGELVDEGAEMDPQTSFADRFTADIAPVLGFAYSPPDRKFVVSSADLTTAYDSDKLLGAIRSALPPEFTVEANGNVLIRMDNAGVPVALDIQGLSVRYLDADGYQNTIYSDFTIAVPPFVAMAAGFRSRLSQYLLVADGSLSADGIGAPPDTTIRMTGNIYTGGIDISGSRYAVDISAGKVVNSRDYIIDDGASLKIGTNASIWGNRITIGTNASADFSGNLYIADDLELQGENASAALNGSYIGFGTSATEGNKSSSLLISGINSTLDIRGLRSLVLGGRSFVGIQTTDPSSANDLPMAGSMSVLSDQIAYLVPDSLMVRTIDEDSARLPNPSVIPTGASPETFVYNPRTGEYTALSTGIVTMTAPVPTMGADFVLIELTEELADYGAGVTRRIRSVASGATPQVAVYWFLTFSDANGRTAAENSALYFQNYYSENKERSDEYLQMYFNAVDDASGGRINPLGSLNSLGTVYEFAGGSAGFELRPASYNSSIDTIASTYATQYKNLKTSLVETDLAAAATPFDSFVKADDIAADFAGITSAISFTDEAGRVRGLILPPGYSGTLSIDASNSDVNIVISCGADIVLAREFKGLIVTRGNVAIANTLLNNTMLSDGNDGTTYEAFGATYNGKQLLEYMIGSVKGAIATENNSPNAKTWNLNELVTYKNWSKNEER